jgi:hypothetical protein
MFLLGDSHARMLLGGLRKRFEGFSVRFLSVTGRWCCGFCSIEQWPPELLKPQLWSAREQMLPCDNYAKIVMESLRRLLRPGDIVIVSNYDWHADLKYGDDHHEQFDYHYHLPLGPLVTRIEELHMVVHSQGSKLVLVGSPPHLRTECQEEYFGNCTPRHDGSTPCGACDVTVAHSELRHKPLTDAYIRLASELADTLFFDIHKILCDTVTCGAMIPGTSVVGRVDHHHVSRAASIYVAQFLCSALSSAGWTLKSYQPFRA